MNVANMNSPVNETLGWTTETSTVDSTEWLVIIGSVFLALTILLIVVLNPLCLLVLHRASGIQETTKLFMASLTISDLCTGIFVALPLLLDLIYRYTWVLGGFLCTLSGIVVPTFYTLSCLSLILLTVDRYIAIIHPLRYPSLMTPRVAKVMIGSVWAATFMVYIIWFGILTKSEVDDTGLCAFPCRMCFFAYYCIFALSTGIILIVYVRILIVARRQARRIAAQYPVGNSLDGQNTQRPIGTKSATTVFLITGAVFICWTPAFVALLLFAIEIKISHNWLTVAQTGFFTNCWLNVIIYYWRNRELRQTLQSMVSSCCRY